MSLPHQNEPIPPRVGSRLAIAVDLLKRIRDGADIFPFRFLKGSISITCSVLELMMLMRSNVECSHDLEKQIKQFSRLLKTLAKSPSGRANMITLKDSWQNDIREFESAMERLEARLQCIARQNKLMRFIAATSNMNQLADIEKGIDKQLSFLQTTVLVQISDSICTGQKTDLLERFDRKKFQFEGPPLTPTRNVHSVKIHTTSGASEGAIKIYRGDIDQFISDREHFLRHLHPHLLEVFGESLDHDPVPFLLLRSPGVKIQLKIEKACNDDQGEACSVILNLLSVLSDAVISLLQEVSGGCLLKEAEIYIKNDNRPVLADWNPTRAYDSMVSPEKQAQAVWDEGFVPLLSKSLTGNPSQANYVYKDDNLLLDRLVVQIVRSLVHFIWDYRRRRPIYNDQKKDLSVTLLQNFAKDINLLQTALVGRYSSWLCGIWDVPTQLDVKPGDVGYITRASHGLRFERLFNIADKAEDDPLPMEIIEIKHYPDAPGAWTSDMIGPELVRHTLHLDSLPSDDYNKIGLRRGWKRASLNKGFDCSFAWKSFPYHARQCIEAMEADGKKIEKSELVLIFSYSGSQGYSFITPSGAGCDLRDRLDKAGYTDRLYYFETLDVREGQLQGYWSRSMEPGQPIWPPTANERDTIWGWEHVNFIPGLTVEVSRKGPDGHFRYLHYAETV